MRGGSTWYFPHTAQLETVVGKETTAYQTKLEQLENKSIKCVACSAAARHVTIVGYLIIPSPFVQVWARSDRLHRRSGHYRSWCLHEAQIIPCTIRLLTFFGYLIRISFNQLRYIYMVYLYKNKHIQKHYRTHQAATAQSVTAQATHLSRLPVKLRQCAHAQARAIGNSSSNISHACP
jgi:hypothetical protein